VFNPDFWAHVADRLRPNDRVEIVAPSWKLEIRVLRIDRSFVTPQPIFRALRVWLGDLEIQGPNLRKFEYSVQRLGENVYRATTPDGRTLLSGTFMSEADVRDEMERLNARFEIAEREQRQALEALTKGRRKSAA
jgi:hypothetical protein